MTTPPNDRYRNLKDWLLLVAAVALVGFAMWIVPYHEPPPAGYECLYTTGHFCR